MDFRKYLALFVFIIGLNFLSIPANAQCAMCKSNLEKAREDGGTQVGNTLNNGILYLLVLPYAIAGVFGFIYFKKHKEKQAANKSAEIL